MSSRSRSVRRALWVVCGVFGAIAFWQPFQVGAQGPVEPGIGSTDAGTVREGTTEASPTPRTDQAIAEQQRRAEEERAARVDRRYRDDHRHHGETYVAGYGGVTFGGTTRNLEGRGTALGAPIDDPTLADSAVYGIKIGYFHPGRLNWLGLELEGFNSTPHIRESGGLPGTHLRLTTLGLNVIARTKLACRDRRDHRDRDVRNTGSYDSEDYSPLRENARCPVHLYAGAGLGVFFAETSNQFGRATDNARAGLNALAGTKYFFNEHVALFAEYKFNYVDLSFDQNQVVGGATAGLNGTYMINHVVGGLAIHF
jgi:hypothetical protein